jgi:alpha-ketoglutarate-dependent taurine dioxygenase
MPHATGSTLTITPLQPPAGSKVAWGAEIKDVDLNNVSEEDFQKIKTAIYEHQLVIIRKQQALKPTNHFDFVHRFDPEAPAVHGHGTAATVTKKWNGKPTLLAAVSVSSAQEQPIAAHLLSYPVLTRFTGTCNSGSTWSTSCRCWLSR